MSRSTRFVILVIAALPLLAVTPTAQADDPAPAAADTLQVDSPTTRPVIDTQLAREVRAVQAEFGTRLAELTARYQTATDQSTAATVQAQIVALKQDLEVQMLDVQLREARRRGEMVEAELIAELLEALAVVKQRQGGQDGEVVPQAEDSQPAAPARAAR